MMLKNITSSKKYVEHYKPKVKKVTPVKKY